MREPSLLVFTLSPAGERRRKRLLPGRLAPLERTLHRGSLDAALEAGRANGCRLEVSSPEALAVGADVRSVEQRGAAFGDRFRGAVHAAHERAEGPLVVVGSDVPGLTGDHVGRALESIGDERDRVVVGPSPDGGFYLLASNRPLDAELESVRWCTPRALESLIAALRASGLEVSLLEPLRDLDRVRDLTLWLSTDARRSELWRGWAARLRSLLAALTRPPAPRSLGRPDAAGLPAFAGRAPPR